MYETLCLGTSLHGGAHVSSFKRLDPDEFGRNPYPDWAFWHTPFVTQANPMLS